ncbi:uncharacterized protein LOC131236049 [Magnolia sinica]|uniref:uncharacterized protein LOC131236049 n=1 Tax=Magnolia sinica TaxID=86752 RepID=UPI0026590D3B|nr:uncharacterized protein LOC131236049 [Magnolia sinica]
MGRYYWGRKEGEGKVEGIVVVFAGLSTREKHLKPYVQLYASAGWNSLVCLTEFLYLFFPDKATTLALVIVGELLKEVRVRPIPIVFAAFSGGPKSCMYKVLQIIEGKCEGQPYLDEYRLIRDCLSGHIYDSSPVDFTSDFGTNFAIHPRVLKMSQPPRVLSWIARGFASGMDFLFLSRFEEQRAEYWQTLYSSVNTGPFLILCSEDDDLTPYQLVCNFAQRLQDLGGDVKLVKWNSSPHVGHYKHHPVDYKAAVTELLEKAALIYSQRMLQLNRERTSLEGAGNKISESVRNLREAAVSSNESLQRVAVGPSNHFLPSSVEYHESKNMGSMQDEQKERLIHLQTPPSISAHSVLGKILFDVCVPKNIEDWDIRPAGSLNGQIFSSSHRHRHSGLFNPIKCIRRSRL